MLYTATGKPAHLGCKFLLDVSVVNSPIDVELLVITVLFFTLHVSVDNLTHHQEYICCIWPQVSRLT